MERVEPLRSNDESRRHGPLRSHYRQQTWSALMAEAALVDLQLKEGQRLIDRLVQAGAAVTAAAWVKESESGDWYLYLVTPLVGEGGGKKAAYHRVNEVIRALQEEGFGMDPFAKKVIGPHDAIAQDLVAHRA